jgi:Amidohydrolase family
VLSADLIARMAASGVVAGIQPSFAVTDAGILRPALGRARAKTAYPWSALAAAGVPMLAGTDYPIEVLEPLVGLARLTAGRSRRAGFAGAEAALPQALLPAAAAFEAMSDPAAGQTLLTADPRRVVPEDLDQIEVLGTAPAPFSRTVLAGSDEPPRTAVAVRERAAWPGGLRGAERPHGQRGTATRGEPVTVPVISRLVPAGG